MQRQKVCSKQASFLNAEGGVHAGAWALVGGFGTPPPILTTMAWVGAPEV